MMAFSILLLAERIMSKTPQLRPCLLVHSAPYALGFTMLHSSLLLEPWVKHGHILHVLATHTTWKRRIQNINSSSSIPIADCTKKKSSLWFSRAIPKDLVNVCVFLWSYGHFNNTSYYICFFFVPSSFLISLYSCWPWLILYNKALAYKFSLRFILFSKAKRKCLINFIILIECHREQKLLAHNNIQSNVFKPFRILQNKRIAILLWKHKKRSTS